MRIDVAILPGQRFDASASVCVVVDVLRASSSIVTLLERGCEAVVAATDIEEARKLHRVRPDYLLCGEADGLPPEGFDYGNSPVEFSRLELAGKSAVLATSNGTRVLAALAAESPSVLVGCLLNRTAVARAALAIAAARGLDVAVVCSAAYGGSVFVLEDALGAGAIVDAALTIDPGLIAGDAARFARDAFATARVRIGEAVRSAYHAQELVDAGLGADVAYCGQLDTSTVAPLLERGEGGVLALLAYPR
ncbi:MAG TPA: 2-phosphosulfolactate phosphatase [Dehalococcoidia bacterium]